MVTSKMSDFKKVTLAVLLVGTVASLSALTVSPARLEVNGDKGTVIQNEFLLINEQDTEITFYTSSENFEAQGESGTPNFTSAKDGLATWIKVTDKVTLKKGERIKIPFSIEIPANADAGGHFAGIFLSTVPPQATDGGQVSVGAKVGMLILLKVNGEVKEEAGILSFNVKGNKRFLTSLPVDFEYRFNNNGGDRVNPKGDLIIRNSIGFETERLDANKNIGNILPNSTRKFEIRWGEEEAPAVSASFFDQVKYQTRNFALGAYFAKLDLKYGESGTDSETTLLFVLPWQLLVVIVVILMIILASLRIAIKKYNKWIIKQARMAAGK